jgi:uncharacterized protein
VTKIIVVILVTVLVVYLLRRMADKRIQPPKKSAGQPIEDMVRCRKCGVNLPRSEAILSQGRFYCCDEHRNSGA